MSTVETVSPQALEEEARIQGFVDQYLKVDAEYKKLDAERKRLRKLIEPYMYDNGLAEIRGRKVKGTIALENRNMAPTSARYTSYDPDMVIPLLTPKAKKVAVTRVIDKDAIEMLVKNKEVPKDILGMKLVNPTICFVTK